MLISKTERAFRIFIFNIYYKPHSICHLHRTPIFLVFLNTKKANSLTKDRSMKQLFVTACLVQETFSRKNLPACTDSPVQSPLEDISWGSTRLEVPEVTGWASVAVWYWALSRVDALLSAPHCVFISSPHLQLVTFVPHQFLTKETVRALRTWMVLLALYHTMALCDVPNPVTTAFCCSLPGKYLWTCNFSSSRC